MFFSLVDCTSGVVVAGVLGTEVTSICTAPSFSVSDFPAFFELAFPTALRDALVSPPSCSVAGGPSFFSVKLRLSDALSDGSRCLEDTLNATREPSPFSTVLPAGTLALFDLLDLIGPALFRDDLADSAEGF